MVKRPLVAIGVVASVIIGALVVWKLRCGGSGDGASADPTSATGGGSGVGTAAGDARRRALATAAPASVSGRITRRADRSAVEGAVVSLARAEPGAMFAPTETPAVVVVSAADGAWRVDAIAPGTYAVAATAGGLLPGVRDKLVVPPNGKLTGIDLALDAGGVTLRGTVTDVGGGGIAGARVTLRKDDENPFVSRPELVALARPDGTYQMQVADGTYQAIASHEDYTRATKEIEIAGAPVVSDFILVPGGVIRGEVATRDGRPVPHAIVQAGLERGRRGEPHSVLADEHGKFIVRGLPSGAIALSASARNLASKAPTIVELGIGEHADGIRILLDGAYTVSGRVVEKDASRKGIPGVRMGVFSMDNTSALAIDPSGDDGAFEILGVRPNTYLLFAMGDMHVPEIGTTKVEVIDRDITNLVVELSTGVTLSGVVEPGAVASISLDVDESKIGLGNMFEAIKPMLARTESAATGEFTLRNAPPGEFTLVANVADGRVGKLPVVVADRNQSGLVVKLENRASLAGRVTDANGAPVVGVRVEPNPDDGGKVVVGFRGDHRGAVTAGDGSFKLVGLDGNRVSVTVGDDHGPLAWADAAHRERPLEPISFDLPPGTARTGVQLVVEARDAWIRGTVLGADKRPVADAWVRARYQPPKVEGQPEDDGSGGDTTPVLTNAEGKFAFERLRRGSYELTAEGPRGTSRVAVPNVRTGQTVTLQLEPLGTLAGRATDGARPVGVFDLTCKSQGHDIAKRIVAADGAYQLERLAPGAYTCSVSCDAGTSSGKVDVPSGAAKLDFAIAAWATISGTVVSTHGGEPVPGLAVLAGGDYFDSKSMTDMLTGHGPVTDAAGRFTVPHVAAGKGKLAVMPKAAGFEPLAQRDYEVTAGQRLDLGIIKVIPPRTGDAGTLGLGTAIASVPDAGPPRLVVATVKGGGPADAAGVKVGDAIVAIDGRPVSELEGAQQSISSGAVAVGQVVKLTLDRNGTQVAATLTAVKW